jgi:hypothetical protein
VYFVPYYRDKKVVGVFVLHQVSISKV